MVLRTSILAAFGIFLTCTGFFTSSALANGHEGKLVELLEFSTPDVPGPHPVVVLVSGCDGFKSTFYSRREDMLREMGYATARVDFMAAREVGGCAYQPTKSRVARDILFVLEHLSGLDAVKGSSVNILAWSSGGGGAVNMMSKLDERTGVQPTTVTVLYPSCNNAFPWSNNVPVLMLLGGSDNMDPAAFCTKLANKSPNANIKIIEYPGAYHAFDDASLPAKSESTYGTMGYQKEAAEKAWLELTQFIAR